MTSGLINWIEENGSFVNATIFMKAGEEDF